MEDRKPIKRKKELVSLSSDHHDELMFCWKVKTGITNGADVERIKRYTTYFYENALRPHIEKEEQYLFPLLPASHAGRMQAESEHAMLGIYVAELDSSDDPITAITDFCKLLEAHIRFEERSLFQQIEQQAAPELLSKTSEQINTVVRKNVADWDDKFWIKN